MVAVLTMRFFTFVSPENIAPPEKVKVEAVTLLLRLRTISF